MRAIGRVGPSERRRTMLVVLAGLAAASLGMGGGAAPQTTIGQRTTADSVRVGDAVLRGLVLRTGSDTTDVYLERDGRRQRISTGIRTVARAGNTWVVSFVATGRGGTSTDTVVAATATFAVIRHVFAQGGNRTDLTYRDGHYRGTKVDSTGSHQVDIPAPVERLDLSLLGALTDALPHDPGNEYVFLAFDAPIDRDRIKDVGYKVIRRDTVSWQGRSVPTWKTVTDFGTHRVTSWVSMDGRDVQWEITRPGARLVGELRG